VRGVIGDCDHDLFNCDLDAFKAYKGLPNDWPTEPTLVVHPAVPLAASPDVMM
jgi:hypothetical protein